MARRDDPVPPLDPFAVGLIRRKARRLIGRAGLTPDDLADVEQDLLLRLLERLRDFDPARKTLEDFTLAVVGYAAADLLRRRRARKRAGRSVPLSTVVPAEGGPAELAQLVIPGQLPGRQGAQDPTEVERADLALDVRSVLDRVPPADRELAERLMAQTLAEACRELGVARSTLADRVRRLRRRFERAGMGDRSGKPRHSGPGLRR